MTGRRIHRRDFVRSAAGFGAGLMANPVARGAAPGMYVSLNGSLTGGKVAWPEFARLAARVGYGGVDVNLPAAMKEGLDSTRALFAETKIKPAYASLPVAISRDDDAYRKSLVDLDSAAQFASAIGCNRMMTVLPPGGQAPKEEMHKIMKDRYSTVAATLARSDIRLGLEFLGPLQFRTNVPHLFIWQMNEALEFAKECGPNVGLLLDVWHWYHSGATVADIIAAGKQNIVAVHLSDCARMPPEDVRDNQRLMPGEGVIPLVPFFQALQKIGYQGSVSPEPLGRVPKEMPAEEGARLGLDSTLAVMRKAGVRI